MNPSETSDGALSLNRLKMPPRRSSRTTFRDYYLLSCQIILLVILMSCRLDGQQQAPLTRAVNVSAIESNPPTASDGGELILSADEFVDSREVPLILIDGTSNENASEAAASANANLSPNNGSSSVRQVSSHNTTTLPDANSSANQNAANATSAQSPPTEKSGPDENAGEDEDVEEETEAHSAPSLGNSFEPPQNISQYMDYIEKLFHDLRHQITHLFEPHLPQLIRTSQMVDLSSGCSYDMLRMALALRQFEPWALRMIDSSGKVPEGIFEGSFTALGSYDECLGTVFQSAGSSHSSSGESRETPSPSSELSADQSAAPGKQAPGPTQGKYCLVTVSPFMPPKPPADKVERLFQEEANRRNYTRDDQFSRLSPMFYYMKFRIGVCIPSTCEQSDMDSISSALSSSLRLNITIPDCRVRQTNQQLTRYQLAGGLTFALVLALVFASTAIDCFRLKWRQLAHQDIEFIQGANGDEHKHQLHLERLVSQVQQHNATVLNLSHRHEPVKVKLDETQPRSSVFPPQKESSRSSLPEQLRKHWTWMSFSLITNFRLYFQSGSASHSPGLSRSQMRLESRAQNPQMIACLNGIRVLSLCWVIVANSYLTLDPRATKRLTKTREASRDFLFQLVVQASLAIETFFFLSGLLMSISFSKSLRPSPAADEPRNAATKAEADKHQNRGACLLKWVQFYVHRYIRMTPPTMLVIAFSMYAYHFGDGPLWFEATQKVHHSCTQNWWRHLLHVANFIDTRQMCFIHYWYIAADMQLFLFAPVIMFLLFKSRYLGVCLVAAIGSFSVGSVFYTTYTRSLPPTLLFYSTDPESRREFGNTIMTKPMTHALPYLVGMLVGWWCVVSASDHDKQAKESSSDKTGAQQASNIGGKPFNPFGIRVASYSVDPVKSNGSNLDPSGIFSATGIFGLVALTVALIEVFLPYQWNNSQLPSRFVGAIYAALFRLGWSLVLAYVVVLCRHKPSARCQRAMQQQLETCKNPDQYANNQKSCHDCHLESACGSIEKLAHCYCGAGGNHLNRLLSLNVFVHLSKLSFVAYLIHLPLMSVFIGQTRGLFAFSHTLVIHFAISYLVISFALSFLLVHFIEFPFITFERLLFDRLHQYLRREETSPEQKQQSISHNPQAVSRQAQNHLRFHPQFTEAATTTDVRSTQLPRTAYQMNSVADRLRGPITGGPNHLNNHQNQHTTTERL